MATLDLSAPRADVVFQAGDYGDYFTVTLTAVSGLTCAGTLTGPDGSSVDLTVTNAGSGTSYILTVTRPAAGGHLAPGTYDYALVGTKTGHRHTLLVGKAVIR